VNKPSGARVARFFVIQYTKMGEGIYQITNGHKIYQIAVIYPKWPSITYTNMFNYKPKIITLTVEKYRTEPWSTSVNKKTLPK
jgi:hypothetical protein